MACFLTGSTPGRISGSGFACIVIFCAMRLFGWLVICGWIRRVILLAGMLGGDVQIHGRKTAELSFMSQ